jgi:hypothetical protein
MDRKHALSTVGAVTVAAGTAALALGVSFGAFGLDSSAPKVGKLSPIDTTVTTPAVEERTIVVQDPPLPATGPTSPASPSPSAPGDAPATPTTVATAPSSSSATRADDDDHADDHGDDRRESEVHDDDDD